MSYISAIAMDDVVRVWERTPELGRQTIDHDAPYYFYVDDPIGKYTTIFNTPVRKIDCGRDRALFYRRRNEYRDQGVTIWESDIGPELRVLSNKYYKVPTPKLNITFLDIETDYKVEVIKGTQEVLVRPKELIEKESYITVEALRKNIVQDDYHVFDTFLNKWVNAKDSRYSYEGETGFSGPKNPYAKINAISLFHEHTQTMVALAIPPNDGTEWTSELLEQECNRALPLSTEYKTIFVVCKDEKELLERFLVEIEDSDLLAGWNAEKYDFPFIGKRIEKVLGKHRLRDMSFPDAAFPMFTEVEDRSNKFRNNPNAPKQTYIRLDLSGRLLADYMILYKKYEASEKPSYKLETISEDILIDDNGNPLLPKLHYEGSLHGLYLKDFAFFVRYNIRDSEILHGFEQKLKYVQLANDMYHLSCALFQHVGGTLKLAELAIINHCHHVIKRVVKNVTAPTIDKKIEGALVLLPIIGLHKLLGSIDINSLYPTAIRSINISPEKLFGQFVEEMRACIAISTNSSEEITLIVEADGTAITAPAYEWREYLINNKLAVSGFGTVYMQDAPGIIPSVLTNWFAERKAYQAKKKEAEAEIKKILSICKESQTELTGETSIRNNVVMSIEHAHLYDQYTQDAEMYDRLQYVYKIKLNSLYGALSNLYFRFYDLRMGESTTGTGRMILTHQCRKVNEILENKYDIDIPMYNTVEDAVKKGHSPEVALHGPKFKGKFQSDSIVAGDTDSTYFLTYANNIEDAIIFSDFVAEQVNDSYQSFMQNTFLCQPDFDNLVKCGREVVSDQGIFVEKKRYMLHLVDVEGKRVDKCKVMGLDTKKTTLPTAVSKRLNRFIERFLTGETWEDISVSIVDYKQELATTDDITTIGLPKGVKNVEEYTNSFEYDPKTRLPGHVAGSILWNILLEEYEDKISLPIMSGMKIKVFYLKQNIGRFKSIAIPTDLEELPEWFITEIVPNISIDDQILRLVDKPLENILKAIGKRSPTKKSLTFESEWEF